MDAIQQKLRELEIAAHSAHMPMDEMLNLMERQFFLAAIQRCGGSYYKAAEDLGRDPTTVYRAMNRIRGRAAGAR
jgi:DNA-binding NtrC family response regulator